MSPFSVIVVSKCSVFPSEKSSIGNLRLSVSDLPMLSCHYIQKGLFFPAPPIPIHPLFALLTRSLAHALSSYPALAGRLITLPDGSIHINCNDAGVDFIHATSSCHLTSLLPSKHDVPLAVKSLFALDGAVSYNGHHLPLATFQLTNLADGAVFIGCTINHAVVDGTSFWNFFNAWAEICQSGGVIGQSLTRPPSFQRNYFGDSKAVIQFPGGTGPEVTFSVNAPLRERIFHFSRESIQELKSKANQKIRNLENFEILGKQLHDSKKDSIYATEREISSFQSLCAQLWLSVSRARKNLSAETDTTFRMAVNCRHRIKPAVDSYYFGNAIQSIPTTALVGEVRARDLRWSASQLHKNVAAHTDKKVREGVVEWEAAPRCFPLGNPNGAGITMGSSPRFPMYEGSVDLEVCLAPETMAALIEDDEFMHFVTKGGN